LARRTSFHKAEKRRKELKRLKKQQEKRERRLNKGKDGSSSGPPIGEPVVPPVDEEDRDGTGEEDGERA